MAIDVWGMLPKSQIDPEKIEEAINRLIAEHNDNEEAHIGAGRSLDQHKLSEVIDHAVASIVADKIKDWEVIKLVGSFERDDFRWYTLFESIDGFSKTFTGSGSITLYPTRVTLGTGMTINSTVKLLKEGYTAAYFTWKRRRKLRFSFTLNATSAETIYMGSGDYVAGENRFFIGVKVEGNALYGVVNDGVSETLLNLNTPVYTYTPNDIMVVHIPDEYTEFFVKGVSKGKIEWEIPMVTDFYRVLLCANIINTGAANKEVWIHFWDFWQEPL